MTDDLRALSREGHRCQNDESESALWSMCFCPVSILVVSPVRKNNYYIITLIRKKKDKSVRIAQANVIRLQEKQRVFGETRVLVEM